ncbi:uncharacterized protein DUF2252 [Novosphingobium sp. PhB165]|nr:uncharacterized protein DUF2252 [Novosphingobium sp. PhB165]
MTGIEASAHAFEQWQRTRLGPLFVEKDLERKHNKMRKGVFPFLRATYWRWSEIVFDMLPHWRDASQVLAIGDTHLENFGTWRDAEGRLVWGANDFDDACVMPWSLDLVRLATSAVLAAGEDADIAGICAAIWEGYREGIAAPSPIILDRDRGWLRTDLVLGDEERKEFWEDFDQPPSIIPASYLSALKASLPSDGGDPVCFARQAGTGSLGKPRFVASLANWRGGPVLREAKGMLPSAWTLFHGGTEAPGVMEVAQGAFRSPDPCLQIHGDILVRRLSPNSRKIEAEDKGRLLLRPRMVRMMGQEIANCHASDIARAAAVRAEVMARSGDWLEPDARTMAKVVAKDQNDFASSGG